MGHRNLSKANKVSRRPQISWHWAVLNYRKSAIFFLVAALPIAACILPVTLPAFGLEKKNSSSEIYRNYVGQVRDLQATPEVLAQSMQLKVQAFGYGQILIDGLGNNTLSGKGMPSRLDFELRQLGDVARNVTSLISVYDESKERAGALVFRDLLSTGNGIFNLTMYDQKTNSSIIGDQDPVFLRLSAAGGSTHVISSSRPIRGEGDYRVDIEIYKAGIAGDMNKAIVQTHLPTTLTYYWDGKGTLSKTPFNPPRNDGQWVSEFDVAVVIGCIVSLTILATKMNASWKSFPSIFHSRPNEKNQDDVAISQEEEPCQYKQVKIPQIGIGINNPNKTFTELYNELSELGLKADALKKTDLSESELEDLCYAMKQLRMTYPTIEEQDRRV